MTTLGADVNVGQGLFIEVRVGPSFPTLSPLSCPHHLTMLPQAFLTAILVLTVVLLAAEKHKSTYLAPVGIGLTLLACHMFGVVYTGCGINPARCLGPSVVSATFVRKFEPEHCRFPAQSNTSRQPTYHWIYWIGPLIGTFMAVGFYVLLKVSGRLLRWGHDRYPICAPCLLMQLFDYTSVVFGQDADHELTASEEALKEQQTSSRTIGLFRQARGKIIIFHSRKNNRGEAEAMVDAFNPANEQMGLALREGEAVVVDLARARYSEDAMEMGRLSNGVPSVKAEAQDVGGLQAPGTERAM